MATNYIISEILNKVSLAGDVTEMKQVLEELKEAKEVLERQISTIEEGFKWLKNH